MQRTRSILVAFTLLMLMLLHAPQSLAVGIGVNPSELDYHVTSDSIISREIYVINTGDVGTRYELYFDSEYQSMFTFSKNGFELEPRANTMVEVSYHPSSNPARTDFSTYLYIKGVEVGKTLEAGIRVPVHVKHQSSTTTTASTSSMVPYTFPLNLNDQRVLNALAYLASQQGSEGDIGGFHTSCWATMAIASAGYNPNDWKKGGISIVDYLVNNRNQIDGNKVTDIAKFVLAITSAKGNPRNVGGVDYVSMLEGKIFNNQFGDESLYNDDFWAIMALVSAGLDKNAPHIQSSVSFVRSHQNGDGGWSWHAGPSSVDDTAAAVMALIAAGEDKNSSPITNAVNYLKSQLAADGGFVFDGQANAASDSWAIMALVAANVNPTGADWKRGGVSPVDHLLGLQSQNDGGFCWKKGEATSVWWTAYAVPALLGKPYPIMQSFTQTYTTTTHTTTTHQIFVTEEHTTSTIAQVYVRIEDLAGTIWKGQVEIPQSTIIECYNSGKTYTIQGDNVLAVLDKASEVGGFSYQVSDQWYPDIGFYVDSIAGHQAQGEYGWMYRVNYSLGDTSINNFSIHASDDILIYWGTDGVRPLKVEVDQSEVDVNETFTATVKYRDDSTGNWIPLAEAKLHVNDDYTTDSEGKVRLTLGEKKVYNIYAEKWGDTSQNQFVRSDIVQVGVGVPVPEIHYLFPVFVACVAAVLYINCSSRKKAAGVPK